MAMSIRIDPAYNVTSTVVLKLIDYVSESANLEKGLTEWNNDIIKELANAYICTDKEVRKLMKIVQVYLGELESALLAIYNFVIAVEAVVDNSRLIIHMRSPYLPLEIGIAWHPLFNLPYIPATSLKGVVRAYAERKGVFPCKKIPSELFGTVGESAPVILTDAYPTSCTKQIIDIDIVNPHYKEVKGLIAEHEVKPSPITFPAVASGVVFRFFIAAKRKDVGACLEDVRSLVSNALSEGIGAKTSIGYGRLRSK